MTKSKGKSLSSEKTNLLIMTMMEKKVMQDENDLKISAKANLINNTRSEKYLAMVMNNP